MPIEFSKVIAGKSRGNGGTFSVQSIDLAQLGARAGVIAGALRTPFSTR